MSEKRRIPEGRSEQQRERRINHHNTATMGLCCSKPAEQLPAVTEEEMNTLKQAGHLPRLAIPKVDQEGENNLQTVYAAHYENGTELTLLFLDEDRPNKCEDCLYDTIRRPLFGRFSGAYLDTCV